MKYPGGEENKGLHNEPTYRDPNGGLTWRILAGVLGAIVFAVLVFLANVIWTNTGRINSLENDVKYLHIQNAENKARLDAYSSQLEQHRWSTEPQGRWILPPQGGKR